MGAKRAGAQVAAQCFGWNMRIVVDQCRKRAANARRAEGRAPAHKFELRKTRPARGCWWPARNRGAPAHWRPYLARARYTHSGSSRTGT